MATGELGGLSKGLCQGPSPEASKETKPSCEGLEKRVRKEQAKFADDRKLFRLSKSRDACEEL